MKSLVDTITEAFRRRLILDLERLDHAKRFDPIAIASVAADAALDLVETLDEIDQLARKHAA